MFYSPDFLTGLWIVSDEPPSARRNQLWLTGKLDEGWRRKCFVQVSLVAFHRGTVFLPDFVARGAIQRHKILRIDAVANENHQVVEHDGRTARPHAMIQRVLSSPENFTSLGVNAGSAVCPKVAIDSPVSQRRCGRGIAVQVVYGDWFVNMKQCHFANDVSVAVDCDSIQSNCAAQSHLVRHSLVRNLFATNDRGTFRCDRCFDGGGHPDQFAVDDRRRPASAWNLSLPDDVRGLAPCCGKSHM